MRVEQCRRVGGGTRDEYEAAGEAMNYARPGEAPERVIDVDGALAELAHELVEGPRPRGGLEKQSGQDGLIDLVAILKGAEARRPAGVLMSARETRLS